LLAGADAEPRQLARQVTAAMQELVRRTSSGNRPGRRPPVRGPVAWFAELEEAGRRLLHLLGGRPLTRPQAEAFAACRDSLTRFAEHFPVLIKLAACRRLVRCLGGISSAAPADPVGRFAAWLDEGQQWLSSFHEEDKARAGEFAEALAPLEASLRGSGQAALRLLLLWLRATQEPGPPEPRLVNLDGAWWLSRAGPGPSDPAADVLVEHAGAGKWLTAGEAAGLLLGRMPAPIEAWSIACELRACLHGLRGAVRRLPARRDACRRLLSYLGEHGPDGIAPLLDGWAERIGALDEGGAADDPALYEEVWRQAASLDGRAPGGLAALRLLALWLQPGGQSRFSEGALKDLDQLWDLTHDPWYTWPADVPPLVQGMIAAAAVGDWSRLAEAAGRALRRFPDVSATSRSAAEDFRRALRRLARRRGERGRPAHPPPKD
jgi:hypothetical protein